MKRNFDTLGAMIDMSRNAIMSVEQVKAYLSRLQKMGYNAAMLYTEDTYEVEGEPYFGYMRGRFSVQDLCELDAYAASLGIELVPCIQTLAHLQGFVNWGQVPVDRDDILMVDEPRVYELIEHMIATVRKCFKSNRIHIGMDEAWALGRGKFLDKHGYESATSIIKRHLARVMEILHKHGFQPMMWSDMFFFSIPPEYTYYRPKMQVPAEVIASVPEDISLVYWDYYHEDTREYEDMLYNHKQLTDKVVFAASAWSTHGFLPLNRYSFKTIRASLDACRKYDVRELWITSWQDDGGECSRYALMPSFYFFAEYARGNRDEEAIKAGFARMFGAELEDFLSLDDLNFILKDITDRGGAGPKGAFYNDPFNGLLDCRVDPAQLPLIRASAERWHDCAKKYRKWGYLFDTAAKLADVLAVKYDLGLRTRAAYLAGDKDALRQLAVGDYAEVAKRIKRFYAAFEKQWYRENKPTGFDVQDIRIGGLLARIDSCRRRLLDFVNGRVEDIPELAFQLLADVIPNGTKKTYGMIATPNRLTHKIV